MRVAMTPAVAGAGPPAHGDAAARRRPDWFEFGLLAVLAVLSMWVVVTDLYQAAAHHLVWTHTDGFFIVDQMQYLAWIQSAAHHLLISNLYVLRPTPADYFQPAIVISAGLVRLGVAPWLALMLWKPVAVIGIFAAARSAVHRTFAGQFERRVALTLCLLFGSLSLVYGSVSVVGDMMPVWLSWGYPFGLIAVALIVVALLRYDHARRAGRMAWSPGLLAALAGSLHPWQGEMFVLIVAGAELVRGRETLRALRAAHAGDRPSSRWLADPRLALPLGAILITLAPLLYYLALGHLDLDWSLARVASRHTFPFSAIAIGIAPLAVFAALGYRGRSADFFELLMRVWAPAATLIYLLSATALSATPLHAFDGITIPLALLAVKGVRETKLRRVPRGRWLVYGAVALGTIPAIADVMQMSHSYTDPRYNNANFITHNERDAVRYLARDRDRGGVLSQSYLGNVVPAMTSRPTFLGDCLWSEPLCIGRGIAANALFQGQLSPAQAQQFVRNSGARFLLSSCDPRNGDPSQELGGLVVATHRFGCATVYELSPPAPPTGRYVWLGPAHAV